MKIKERKKPKVGDVVRLWDPDWSAGENDTGLGIVIDVEDHRKAGLLFFVHWAEGYHMWFPEEELAVVL